MTQPGCRAFGAIGRLGPPAPRLRRHPRRRLGIPHPPGIAPGLADDPRDRSRADREVADVRDPHLLPTEGREAEIFKETPDKPLPSSLTSSRDSPSARRRVLPDAGLADRWPPPPSPSDARSKLRWRTSSAARPPGRAGQSVGLTDVDRLADALGPYTDEQIRHAVDKTAALARHGTVTSPIGWLIAKAGQGDPDFYPRREKPHIPPSMKPPFTRSQQPPNRPTPTPKRRWRPWKPTPTHTATPWPVWTGPYGPAVR